MSAAPHRRNFVALVSFTVANGFGLLASSAQVRAQDRPPALAHLSAPMSAQSMPMSAQSMPMSAQSMPMSAQSMPAPPQPQAAHFSELRSDTTVDLAITGATALAWLGSELLKPWLAPSACRVCDRNADGSDSLNGLDREVRTALKWSTPATANWMSYAVGYVAVPAASLGLSAAASREAGGRWKTVATDTLIVAEAATLAGAFDQIVKFSVGRERPFVHQLSPHEKDQTTHPSDNNLSFFSGHTTFAFAVATSAGTVASLRGYPFAPAVWAVGIPLAVTTGYLRIAADRHYFTDVIVGAIVGSAVGVTIPLAFHPRSDTSATGSSPEVAVGVSTSPLLLNLTGVF